MLFQPINRNYHDFTIVRDKDACINCKVCIRQCAYEAHYWDETRQKVMHDNAAKLLGLNAAPTAKAVQGEELRETVTAIVREVLMRMNV